MPRLDPVRVLERSVEWHEENWPGGRALACTLGPLFFGRVLEARIGWLVAPAGACLGPAASDQDEAKTRLLELAAKQARRFLDHLRNQPDESED